MEQFSYWISRDAIDDSTQQKQHIMICLTLYNESGQLLQSTLESIARNVEYLEAHHHNDPNVLVCIIADGASRISASSLQLVRELGIYPEECKLNNSDDGLHVVETTIATHRLLCQSDEQTHATSVHVDEVSKPISFKTAFCVKPANLGKLDSHWWFFEKLCPSYQPDYCFQIDTGTVLEQYALQEMVQNFEHHPQNAAIAGNVIVKEGRFDDLLHAFQCADLAVQKAILWPSEIFCGYLSVIPGQFSGVCWKALSCNKNTQVSEPKERYLRGLECETAIEQTMFLAEDRIMGFELLAHKGSDNRLVFSSEAVCYTDTCETVDELLKQRRRWVNSSFTSRGWMLKNIVRYLKDSATPVHKKILTSFSVINMGCFHLFEWFLPLFNILFLAASFKALTAMVPPTFASHVVTWGAFAMMAIVWFLPTLLAVTGHLQKCSKTFFQRLMMLVFFDFFALIGINVFALIHGYAEPGMAFFIAVPFLLAVTAIISGLILHKTLVKPLLFSIVQYIGIGAACYQMICTNAFFNLNDNSWGTKGLTQKQSGLAHEDEKLLQSFSRLRSFFLVNWIISNLVLIVAIIYSDYISLTMSVIGMSQIVIIVTGLLGALAIKMSAVRFKKKNLAVLYGSAGNAGNVGNEYQTNQQKL